MCVYVYIYLSSTKKISIHSNKERGGLDGFELVDGIVLPERDSVFDLFDIISIMLASNQTVHLILFEEGAVLFEERDETRVEASEPMDILEDGHGECIGGMGAIFRIVSLEGFDEIVLFFAHYTV